MNWRKWLVRGLVYSACAGFVLLYVAYYLYTNPTATRKTVLDKLGEKFIGATISLQSARLNLLDGISISELRMARRDDLDKTDFLYVPSAVMYHDKEQLLDGKLALRKIVMNRPQVRLLFDRNGRCNFCGLLGPVDPNERVPTMVLQQGTILLEDRRLAVGKPILEIRNVNMTILNDPLPTLVLDGGGQTDVLGPIQIRLEAQRVGCGFRTNLELPGVPFGPLLVQRLAEFLPDLAVHLRQFQAQGTVHASFSYKPETPSPLGLNVTCQVRKGYLTHARLPFPLENLELGLSLVNDPEPLAGTEPSSATPSPGQPPPLLQLRVPSAMLTAKAGSARLEAHLKDLVLPRFEEAARPIPPGEPNTPPGGGPPRGGTLLGLPISVDELPARELNWKIEHLAVTPDLFDYLPENLLEYRKDYKPCGPISVTHSYRRSKPGQWTKQYSFQPEGMEAECAKFPYPLHDIKGVIERHSGSDNSARMDFDLTGYGGLRPVTCKGSIEGDRFTSGVDLEINAIDVPIDDQLHRALPLSSQLVAAQFHSEGLADIKAQIRRTRGTREFNNRYQVLVHNASLKYDLFPYPLRQVRGVLEIFNNPDYWVCHDFRGVHHDGEIYFSGQSYPPTPQMLRDGSKSPSKVRLEIQGKDVLMNKEFEESLAPPAMPSRAALLRTFRTLALSGRINFNAEVIDIPSQPRDLKVDVTVRDCRMKPRFFEYDLSDVSGTVSYYRDQMELRNIQARHGATRLVFPSGQVTVTGENSYVVDIPALRGEQIVADGDLLAAIPPILRRGLAALHVQGAVNLNTQLRVVQKEPTKPPVVWWDGDVQMPNNALNAGVELTGLRGVAWCTGLFDGQQLEELNGNLCFEKATILGQPFAHLKSRVMVQKDSPQVLRFRNMDSEWFGGKVGAEARVDFFGPKIGYEVKLTGMQIQLEQFGRHNIGASSDMQGQATVQLHLIGTGPEITDLKGNGVVNVPSGKLYRLPPLLSLLNFIGLRFPEQTAFEQAYVVFGIDQGKVQVENLELIGNAISLRGQGTANVDGSNIDLDVHTDWGRVHQVLPPALGAIPRFIGDQLFKIKVQGKLGDLHFKREALPVVSEPIKKAFGAKN